MNNENIEKYESGKIYIPEKYINENYKYIIDNEDIIIITNNNCNQNYNTTYCDAIRYNQRENILTEPYQININQNNNIISIEHITSDMINNTYIKDRYMETSSTYLLVLVVGILFATFLTKERTSY